MGAYDKRPVVRVAGQEHACWQGEAEIARVLREAADRCNAKRIVVECYPGVFSHGIERLVQRAFPEAVLFDSRQAMLDPEGIESLLRDDITDDELFGFMTRREIDCYFDPEKMHALRQRIASAPRAIICGVGSAYVADAELLVYADLARWEIQQRFRRGEAGNVGADNERQKASLKYKRAFFTDWRICDRFKRELMPRWDFVLDTASGVPKMASAEAVRQGLRECLRRPFRLVPFFDPGPWGGQWMKEVCDLDRSEPNFAWCFDCVPEENSLLLGFGQTEFELPALDLLFAHPRELLGDAVYGRFGTEFPIRFDLLDTMGGGNLSLQVHPSTDFIRERFGMPYTQDESYYLLDAADDATIFLGLKEDTDPDAMFEALRTAQAGGEFDAEKYVDRYPVRKHDHISIPAGTIHCSGAGGMVLEISSTPFIFTFKLWDWGRMGLDGMPRPLNIDRGERVIRRERRGRWVRRELLNRVEEVARGDGWREERTGLHESEFIETRRHWFTGTVPHLTDGSVHVLNLVEGREAVVESPSGAFEPLVVHYAETFIVPAAVGEYTLRPWGESQGKRCATVKASVRHKA